MAFNKPDITQLSALGSTTGDLYFPQTTLLLPFDGTNGSTSTTDSSNSNHSVAFVGTAQLSTTQSKFGGSSLLLDGNSDYLTVGGASDFNLGSSDFTIEAFVRFNSVSGVQVICGKFDSGANRRSFLLYMNTGGVLKFLASSNGSAYVINIDSGSTTFSVDTWYHVAATRSGSTFRIFIDGTQVNSATSSSSLYNNTNDRATVGIHWSSSSAIQFFNGYIEDLRITKGIARYTSTFTPHTTAHLTSAGDVNKQILINETADGVAIGTGGINQARIAKAWVNFNGTGTVAIRGNYNVSSITDNGVGIYTVNFSSNMSDTNYAVSGSIGSDGTASGGWLTNGNNTSSHTVNNTTSSCRVTCNYQTSLLFDPPVLSVNIFGN